MRTVPHSGTFTVPGHFQARAPAVTTIYAEAEALYSVQAFAFAIDPAGQPQQVGVVDVLVQQTTTGGFLPGASVEFLPTDLSTRTWTTIHD
jgi:hypothetical protein